jgi:hypothetical protein
MLFMEHRYDQRSQVNEPVELWNGEEKYSEFEIENICSGGIFVKNCLTKVDTLAAKTLTIKFSYNPNLSYQASHQAILVHKTNNGIGFKWPHNYIN